ncbi:hydantoinase/oxoprolinase family protein [Mesorhizobium sp. M1E.F.Ca.ET.041.01.1.1]|uniref:hydantoinase/oxoprolinase family protein n=1 Tax=Mesorhizobium sp. M1E.F.Ca.ET.041.01.1.1 TaxID=2496759 RepID=UPI000FCA755D|nr:hydantoinase/oxoprolinase family protein [Mesorhizobium sp. M1E.F.Ca.ET.041.01.1.1]RUW36313.1 hydantoinase/oxoprolinase family protein [Mesorhizobium sp. M1E.F.Ca.ET.041.01.1.1]
MPSASENNVRLSADIGGTFTDVVLERNGARWSRKVLTTHKAPEQGLLAGIDQVLQESGVSPQEVGWFTHGTTLATNALLEQRGVETALLTTEGFRDVLEIAYESRYDTTNLRMVQRQPLVARERRFTIRERLAADGSVLIPLDDDGLTEIAHNLEKEGIESLAIGFLHAYANPIHERRARDIIGAALPNISISLSSDIAPEIGEYERISTVVANAYVQPIVFSYLERLSRALADFGLDCPFLLMTSGGGLAPLDLAKQIPIRLVESGPAGGAVLSSSLASELNADRILSFDVGGTTAKICFIAQGKPQVARMFEVDRVAGFRKGSGLPLRIAVVELVEIGAGGGSLARIDSMGRIAVGPQSAGSEPGPVSYNRGGDVPTITDAHLIMGRITPERFAAGTIPLRPDLAAEAVDKQIASVLGLDVVNAASGILEIVDEAMTNAIRVHGAELGKDVADHVMIAFGGAAPLHAARLAEKLGIHCVVIPRNAGVGSALGFLRAPLAHDIVVSKPLRLADFDPAFVAGVLADLLERAEIVVKSFGGLDGISMTRQVDMRYVGQGNVITIPLADDAPTRSELHALFDKRYQELFGRVIPDAAIEIVSWQMRLSKQIWQPTAPASPSETKAPHAMSTRAIFNPQKEAFENYDVYERQDLSVGAVIAGPALVVEDETTTVVTSTFSARVDTNRHLILERRLQDGKLA